MSTNASDEARAPRGRFFVLDGVDGCGKSTQAERLAAELRADTGREVVHLREPGSTTVGESLRALLLDPATRIGAEAETLLFVAARRQMLDELVEPALAAGRDVVCERFHPSTFAYQAVAGGLDEDEVLRLMRDWAGEPAPDRTVLLDLPVEDARERAAARGTVDRFEAKGAAFHARVAEGYRRYAERGASVVVVDARGSADDVARRVREGIGA